MGQISPAVKHLIIANVIFFSITLLYSEFKSLTAIWYFLSPEFHWWQVVSNMFMHANLTHLFFNMFALYSFGVILENILGSNRFLLFYFCCGLGAVLLHTGVNYFYFEKYSQILVNEGFTIEQIIDITKEGKYYLSWKDILSPNDFDNFMSIFYPAMGASGAIYGVLVAFGMLFPNAELSLFLLPIGFKAKYFIPVLLLVDLFSGVTGFSIFGANIAHFAHLGGALIGFILIYIWKKNSFNDKRIY